MKNDILMQDALGALQQAREQLNDPASFITALLVSLIAAFAASLMYRFFYERRGTGSQVHRAFPLLAISITTLFVGVQLSLPLSLGLLGALSIIRFRTPIKEPEEVGFIMLVIAASICAATASYLFIWILYGVALMALVVVRAASAAKLFSRGGVMIITMSADNAAERIAKAECEISPIVGRIKMESASTRDGVSTFQYVFSGLRAAAPALQKAVIRASGATMVNVYLDKPGGIR